MKTKIQKLVKENFGQTDTYEDDDLDEHSLFKKSVDELLDNKIEHFPADSGNITFPLKSQVFPSDFISNVSAGKGNCKRIRTCDFFESPSEEESSVENSEVTSINKYNKRKRNLALSTKTKYEKSDVNQYTSEETDSNDEIISTEDLHVGKPNKRVRFDISQGKNEEDVDGDNEDDEGAESFTDQESNDDDSVEDESELEDDVSGRDEAIDSSFVYFKSMRDESSEIEKGEAVKNQLSLWEVLLESRIMLQKCLVECNKLPKPDYYTKVWSECSSDDKKNVYECREYLWNLLEKLIHVQDKYRKQCAVYMQSIKSNTKDAEETEGVSEDTRTKHRKLTDYPKILEENFNQYAQFRNDTIQKWNDRTKIASGKYAKSNFTAFDQPVLKQIEQIMNDKQRLIKKTYVKRSQYQIVGEVDTGKEDEKTESNLVSENDPEIFDDDDFYLKLLRDFIEKKTADISDPTQLGKKWIQLQSLRTKMKRKIDTKKTKGRKINFNVHNKLVNFMAPNVLNRWQNNSTDELYSSVFGKNLIRE